MSFERLQDKIREMKNPTVAGLDPKLEYVPSFIVEEKMKQYGQTLRCAAEAIYEYNVGLIDALCDVVPAVKPQSAFYERFGFEGVEVLKRTVDYAKGFMSSWTPNAATSVPPPRATARHTSAA